jgi:hypothetical protein
MARRRFRRMFRRLLLRRATRTIVVAGVVLALVGSITGVVITTLANAAPVWWRSVQVANESTRELAVHFENAVSNQLTSARPVAADLAPGERWRSEPWSVAIEPREVNAWLNARMPAWLESRGDLAQWPQELEELQVDFESGLIRVGVQVRTSGQGGGRRQIVTANLRPRVDEEGSIWMPAERLDIGRLSLPASWVLANAQGWAGEAVPSEFEQQAELSAMFDLFKGLTARADPVIALPDGRQVRLLDVRAREGRLVLTCVTELR